MKITPTLVAVLLAGTPLRGSTFYVTIAGLGGEPDYEQRFTAAANDLDKIFHSSTGAHIYTLTGRQASRARLTEVLGAVAREARPEDDLIVTLIGHGTFDGTEYKFNLVGPDITAAELAGVMRSRGCEARADRQHDERERWIGGRAATTWAGSDRGNQIRYREERYGLCKVLGGGARRPNERPG